MTAKPALPHRVARGGRQARDFFNHKGHKAHKEKSGQTLCSFFVPFVIFVVKFGCDQGRATEEIDGILRHHRN
jgi:hypothetical protein